MAILQTRKFKCKKCGNTFVTTQGDVLTPLDTNICQECGGTLSLDEMNTLDQINPMEKIKSVKHTVKSLFSFFSKK